jgi:hypothetical protein
MEGRSTPSTVPIRSLDQWRFIKAGLEKVCEKIHLNVDFGHLKNLINDQNQH